MAHDAAFETVLDHYRRLFAEGDESMLGYAACVTVLPGWTDEAAIAGRLGVFRREESVTLEDFSAADLDAVMSGGTPSPGSPARVTRRC